MNDRLDEIHALMKILREQGMWISVCFYTDESGHIVNTSTNKEINGTEFYSLDGITISLANLIRKTEYNNRLLSKYPPEEKQLSYLDRVKKWLGMK